MAAFIYYTPDNWKPREGTNANTVSPTEALLLEIYNQLYLINNGGGLVSNVVFTSINADYTYTSVDVPGLANMTTKTVIACFIDGVVLALANVTWNGTTLTFNSGAVTFTGAEVVTVLFT